MKRDMDLVRKLLFALQKEGYVIAAPDVLEIEGYDDQAISYHLTILSDSPYVLAHMGNRGAITHYRLTWQGHEFIDSIADPDRWDTIKETSAKVGGFTFDMIAKIATELMTKAVSGQLGI